MNSGQKSFDLVIVISAVFVGVFHANIEQGCLGSGMFAQFGHLVDIAIRGFLLLSLCSAFRLFPLFLLTRLFFLALGKS